MTEIEATSRILITTAAGHINTNLVNAGAVHKMVFDTVQSACAKARTQGAVPLSAVDDISMHSLRGNWFAPFVDGLGDAAEFEGIAIVGGEMAQMSSTYNPGWISLFVTVVSLKEKGD